MMSSSKIIGILMAAGLVGCGGRAAATPTVTPFAPVLPTAQTPGTPELQPPAAAIPTPESVTTEQITQRLDPFADPQCALPCYNGLTPSQGDFGAAMHFYSRFGIGSLDMVPGDYQNALDGTGHLNASLLRATDVEQAVASGYRPPRIDVVMQGGVVNHLIVNWAEYPARVTLPIIFQQLGQPDSVKIGLVFGNDPVTFLIELIYTAKQTGFVFSGATQTSGQALAVCMDATAITTSAMGVYSPGDTPLEGMAFEKNMLRLEESTGLTYDQFAALAQGGNCLNIGSERWGQWQAPKP